MESTLRAKWRAAIYSSTSTTDVRYAPCFPLLPAVGCPTYCSTILTVIALPKSGDRLQILCLFYPRLTEFSGVPAYNLDMHA